jgi:predicted transcriptional regulator
MTRLVLHTHLSTKNRELLETIRRRSPQSLAKVAERTGSKKSNLSRTLKTMEQYGLVQISRTKKKLVPRVRYQRVAVLMELKA